MIPWLPKKSISKPNKPSDIGTLENNLMRTIHSREVDKIQTEAPFRHTPEDCEHEWLEVVGEFFLLCKGCGNYGAIHRVLLSRKEAKQLRKSGTHHIHKNTIDASANKIRLHK